MPKILVVDDLPLNVEYLEGELQALGYEVCTARDGEEALDQIGKNDPDLVLLDLSMPKLDGMGVLREVRKDRDRRSLPIILLTGRSEYDDRVQGLDAGADDYITKPFYMGEVAARIKAQLRIQALQQEILEREKQLARIEGVRQTLVTLAHHINNATQAISGMAQICQVEPENLSQLTDVALKQTERISAVLQSLQQMLDRMELRFADYAGEPDRMFDIEEDLKRRLDRIEAGGPPAK